MIGLFIITVLLINDIRLFSIEFLLWVHVSMLMFHQFEEYIFPGGFKDFFNNNIISETPFKSSVKLNDIGVLLVNVASAWFVFILSAVFWKTSWLALGLLIVSFSNGIMHTAMGIKNRRYIPGLITGILFIPFTLFVFSQMKALLLNDLLLGLLAGVIGNASIFILLKLSSRTS